MNTKNDRTVAVTKTLVTVRLCCDAANFLPICYIPAFCQMGFDVFSKMCNTFCDFDNIEKRRVTLTLQCVIGKYCCRNYKKHKT